MMNIDEAISHAMEVAEGLEKKANTYGIKQAYIPKSREPVDCISCAEDHRQLAEWLMELKDLRAEQNGQYVFIRELMDELEEAKRLLKMAVPIINNSFPEVGSCWGCANHDEVNDECKGGAFAECAEVCKWKYADEALKLIGEDGDTNE